MNRIKKFHQEWLVLQPDQGSFTTESARWSNKDLDPVPQSRKKWEWYHVSGFWVASGFSASYLQTPSSAVALGLSPSLVIIACMIGNFIITIPCMSQGYIGSKYSINFPVLARASFGLWGSYVAIIVRGTICVIWFGVQSSLGGSSVQCMINSIWPSFQSWRLDDLPVSAEITAPALLSFAIFWISTLPFLYLSIPALRWIFLIKLLVMPLFGVALFTWAVTAAHGFGSLFSLPSNVQPGWSVGYAFCYTITVGISGCATFGLNQGDLTRYAHNPRGTWLAQLALPITITLIEFLGTVLAASSQVLYGRVIWNPLDIVLLWDNRPAKFFAGFLFAFAMITTNVAGNSIPFGNDLMGLFPKYINIRRGQFVCAILGFAICPWLIEVKATSFLAFLNGYSVFLGPLTGVIMTDFWLVRNGRNIEVCHLYKPQGIYWYTRGWNMVAIASFLIGVVPLLPGLAYQINPSVPGISRGYLEVASLSWIDGAVFSSVAYYLLYRLFPFPIHTKEEDTAMQANPDVSMLESDLSESNFHHSNEKHSLNSSSVLV